MMLLKHFFHGLAILALTGLGLMASIPCFSQDKENEWVTEVQNISVDKTVYDLGTVSSTGEPVKATFVITNNTQKVIALAGVKASCGCTTPSWTKAPIEPGKTGEIVAAYDPKGHKGAFEKTLTIQVAGAEDEMKVTIKGVVE